MQAPAAATAQAAPLQSQSSVPLHPAVSAVPADTAAATETASKAKMEADKDDGARASSTDSSESEKLPSTKQGQRNVRVLREEVDELVDEAAGLKKQLL